MREYPLIMPNMIGYASIDLEKSLECARILNVSDAVYSVRSLYKLLSSYGERDIFKTLSNII